MKHGMINVRRIANFKGFLKSYMIHGKGRLIKSQGDFNEGELVNDKAYNFCNYISRCYPVYRILEGQ